jgi:glucose-6-phosphate 1-epimerase
MKNAHGIEAIDFNGLPALRLAIANGSEAIVSLFGGQVLSWKVRGQREWLYFSEQADCSGKVPLRGGVPVCFPQFADQGSLPKHGFARTAQWEVTTQRSSADYALVALTLTSSEATRALWPHDFRMELCIGVEEERLDLELEVENTGSRPFSFTTALHSYLRVSEVEEIRLEGLRGCRYLDSADGGESKQDSGVTVVVDREVDRIYCEAPATLLLRDDGRSLGIHSENLPDTVVWNPWQDKCAALPDMADQDFRHMLCVESAAIETPIIVPASETWWGRQTLIDLTYAAAREK